MREEYEAEDWNKWVALCEEAKRFHMKLVPEEVKE